jgi:Asparagine synthase (glutamine-hydrolyzing)
MMNSILGILGKNNRIDRDKCHKVMDELCIYKSDFVHTWNNDNIFLGCSIQFTTKESKSEKSPFYDSETGLVIVSDATIYNREELIKILYINYDNSYVITDSDILLSAYKKWGKECPKYIVGDFAFSIWCERSKELFCARDHVGKRTLYFYDDGKTFLFCTLIKPILNWMNKNIELNYRWIADFLSIESVVHESECNETIYKNIYQLPPGSTFCFNNHDMNIKRYWNPLETKPLKLKNDYEYNEAFKEVFFKAVKSRLRSEGDIGVMLSGGLDSTAVASVAAKELQNCNRNLKAFSSVPIDEYKEWLPQHFIANESEYIETMKEFYHNIDITYAA